MSIPPEVLVHVREALLGAAGIAIEDLGTLTSDLEAECEKKEGPDGPGKRAAYHELTAAVLVRYDLQKTIGLPGDPLITVKVRGRSSEELVVECLTDYRDALVARKEDDFMEEAGLKEAAESLQAIEPFLTDRQTSRVEPVA